MITKQGRIKMLVDIMYGAPKGLVNLACEGRMLGAVAQNCSGVLKRFRNL